MVLPLTLARRKFPGLTTLPADSVAPVHERAQNVTARVDRDL